VFFFFFFSKTGTEANKGVFKFPRKWEKSIGEEKIGIVSFTDAFHGRTMGSLSATPNKKYQSPFMPLVPGFKLAPFNDISKINEFVNDSTCAVIVEPIQGEGGVWIANQEFLKALRKRCDEVEALLIYDEIQCGLGRTGKLWAHQNFPKSCHPDILTMAKPLGGGYPIGAIMTTQNVADTISVGDHGTTFGGSPLACKVALSVLKRINEPEFLSHVNEVGNYMLTEFKEFASKHLSLIKEVRGRGLIIGIQLNKDPTPLVKLARERGLLIITAGHNTVRIIPPLIIKKEEAERGIEILKDVIQIFEENSEN